MSENNEGFFEYRNHLKSILDDDLFQINKKDEEYGGSWKKRGGVGAYMMAVRKIDRLEEITGRHKYDIFEALKDEKSSESLIDTIRDLRRYLVLIEAEYLVRKKVDNGRYLKIDTQQISSKRQNPFEGT